MEIPQKTPPIPRRERSRRGCSVKASGRVKTATRPEVHRRVVRMPSRSVVIAPRGLPRVEQMLKMLISHPERPRENP